MPTEPEETFAFALNAASSLQKLKATADELNLTQLALIINAAITEALILARQRQPYGPM